MSLTRSFIEKIGDQFKNPITLVDLEAEEQPLVYVNEAFCELTGYPKNEILGKNCRFLQGQNTDVNDAQKIGEAIKTQTAIFCDLANYRKDGSEFYNRLVLLPITLENIQHYIGMQIDSTSQVKSYLAKTHGKCFNDVKTSALIRDKINNPLMKIKLISDEPKTSLESARMLADSFEEIRSVIQSLPI